MSDVVEDPAELDIKHFSDGSETKRSTSTLPEPTTPTDEYEDITLSTVANSPTRSYLDTSVAFWPDASTIHEPVAVRAPQRRGEDPMQFLLVEEKSMNMRLNELIIKHAEASKRGVSTKNIRENITRCFKSLGLVYQAMSELYETQVQQREQLLKAFKGWESAKRVLNANIEEIKSVNSTEGQRLGQLQSESKELDDEIEDLERRLDQLKNKRKLLRTEIVRSQSVIESRTSSHLEALKEIQDAERDVVKRLFEDRTVVLEQRPASMIGSFLTRITAQSLPQVSNYDPDQIIDIIERQVDSLKDSKVEYASKEKLFEESLLIWTSTSERLSDLEHSLKVTLKSQRSDTQDSTKLKLQSLLSDGLEFLQSRANDFKNMNDVLRTLFQTEIYILRTGIQMLEPKKRASPQPLLTPGKITIAEPTLSTSPRENVAAVATYAPSASLGNRLKDNLSGRRSSPRDKNDKKD